MDDLEKILKRAKTQERGLRVRRPRTLKLLKGPGLPPKKVHMTKPCENCPYRQDAPRNLWNRREFEGVLDGERSPLGKIFACHKQAAFEDPRRRGFCAGWFLDQKKRNFPSILLRAAFSSMGDEATTALVEACNAEGLELFDSVDEMCRANGVAERRRGARSVPMYQMVKVTDGLADGKILVLRTCEGLLDTYFDPTAMEPIPGPYLGVHRVTKLAKAMASLEIVSMVARMLSEQYQLVQAAQAIARHTGKVMTATCDGHDLATAGPDGTVLWFRPPMEAPGEVKEEDEP